VNYRLYRFDQQPPEKPPVGMNELVAMGHYLNAKNALYHLLKRVKPNLRMFYNGQPATHLGLYDWNDRLVHVQKLEGTK